MFGSLDKTQRGCHILSAACLWMSLSWIMPNAKSSCFFPCITIKKKVSGLVWILHPLSDLYNSGVVFDSDSTLMFKVVVTRLYNHNEAYCGNQAPLSFVELENITRAFSWRRLCNVFTLDSGEKYLQSAAIVQNAAASIPARVTLQCLPVIFRNDCTPVYWRT